MIEMGAGMRTMVMIKQLPPIEKPDLVLLVCLYGYPAAADCYEQQRHVYIAENYE
jgi:hypothetical protein